MKNEQITSKGYEATKNILFNFVLFCIAAFLSWLVIGLALKPSPHCAICSTTTQTATHKTAEQEDAGVQVANIPEQWGLDVFDNLTDRAGTKLSIPPQESPPFEPSPSPLIKLLGKYTVTAYCPCEKCCGKWANMPGPRVTANGHKIQDGDKFVAAPKNTPFNTWLYIKGYSNEPIMVLDRGGAIKGKRLDVFFPTHQEALNWGVKEIEVFEVQIRE
jgi:3D (Asp-Asp-Asp) domain-containing protein